MSDTLVYRRNDGSDQPNPPIPVSFFAHTEDTGLNGFYNDINRVMPWLEFGGYLETCSTHVFGSKPDAPLFSPTTYKGRRGTEYATTSGMLVGDNDGKGLLMSQVAELLNNDGLEAILYTSGSNVRGDRFRIVIPLAEPVSIETQRRAMKALSEYIRSALDLQDWKLDTGKCNAVSIFYVPGQYQRAKVGVDEDHNDIYEPAHNEFVYIQGDVMSAEEWLELFPQPEDQQPFRDPRDFKLSRNVEWNPYDKECWHEYLRKTEDRYPALYSLMVSLAMSALNSLYDITASELADLASEAQQINPPTTPQYRRSWAQFKEEAEKAIRTAEGLVDEPAALRWLNWKAYGQGEPWSRGTKGVESIKAMIDELKAHPEQEDPHVNFTMVDDEPEPQKTEQPVYKEWDAGTKTAQVRPRVGSSRVDLQACKLEYSIVSPK